jgi:hypothetical protein
VSVLGRYRRANVVYWGVNAFLILTSVFGLINVQPAKVTSFLPFENVYLEMPMRVTTRFMAMVPI